MHCSELLALLVTELAKKPELVNNRCRYEKKSHKLTAIYAL